MGILGSWETKLKDRQDGLGKVQAQVGRRLVAHATWHLRPDSRRHVCHCTVVQILKLQVPVCRVSEMSLSPVNVCVSLFSRRLLSVEMPLAGPE